MSEVEFDGFILSNMPSFIAINYQCLLEARDPQEQVALILHIYNLGLRVLTIIMVSQYLFYDRDRVVDPYLDSLLEQKFPRLTPDAWEEILFTTLRAYEDNHDLFFMPELYDFYWDTSTFPHRRRAGVEAPFDRLTQVTIELQTERLEPQDELGWQALASELLEYLRKILQSLSFIGMYNLIHVLAQDEHTYTFELYKGTSLSIGQQPLFRVINLIPGWLYLRSESGDVLPLHPLLVILERKLEEKGTISAEIGVFDRLVYERIRYLLTTPGQTWMDQQHVKAFLMLIYDTITETKHRRQEVEKLTWVQLCDICEEITAQRMASAQGRYYKKLYLQRSSARQHIEAFLADPKKHGFVLVGKSGVGKSSFLLAFAEELRQSRDDVCLLMYDGAFRSIPLIEVISQDFADHLGRPVQDIWHAIAQIDGIDKRQVILCVDAINENLGARQLLRQLDELVQSPWPWLKIVLSSRPETWKEIKRGVKLAEALYYREPSNEILDVELEAFSYSEQMYPFTPQELPAAYSKYQREFDLKTPYWALSPQVREILRDPLQLSIVAMSYQRKAIPAIVKTSTVIEAYINTLELEWKELNFLENQLVPLMVREGHYSNLITEAELDAAGGNLYERIYSGQMNQMFRTLCDADILELHRQGREQIIAFKHEGFYRYFVGERICNLSSHQADQYAFFLNLITTSPSIALAVRYALVLKAQEDANGAETLRKLCLTPLPPVKEMMFHTLIDLDLESPSAAEAILVAVIHTSKLSPKEKEIEIQKIQQIWKKSAFPENYNDFLLEIERGEAEALRAHSPTMHVRSHPFPTEKQATIDRTRSVSAKVSLSPFLKSLHDRLRAFHSRFSLLIDGPVQGVVIGEHNTVTLSFQSGKERTIPFLAPPQPHHLVGRDDLLQSLKQKLLARGSFALSALNGLPGVGKTALALKLAHDHEVLRHFSEGVLWAGLGRDPDVFSQLGIWGVALGILRSEMERLTTIPLRIQAVHEAIGMRSMLLIIDDAWSSEVALTFRLGGPNCAHVLTTRLPEVAQFFTDGETIVVRELGEDESFTLLEQLAPGVLETEPNDVRELIQAVDGLPLPLTLMGKYLRIQMQTGQPRHLRAALDRLREVEERLRLAQPQAGLEHHPSLPENIPLSLLAVIKVSDEALDEETHQVLKALSVFPSKPNTFSEEAALAVAATSLAAIDALLDSGLLESSGPSRYTLHQTIRDYARTQLGDVSAYEERLVDYFIEYVRTYRTDYRLLEREISNLTAALQVEFGGKSQPPLERDVSDLVYSLLILRKTRAITRIFDMLHSVATNRD